MIDWIIEHTPEWLHSIRTKVLVLITLLIFIISTYIYIVVPKIIESRSLEMTKEKAESIGTMTAYSIRAALDLGFVEDINIAFNNARQNEDIVYIMALNDRGRVIASFNPGLAEEVNYRQAVDGEHLSGDESVFRAMTPVIHTTDKKIGELYLGLSTASIKKDVEEFQTTALLMSLIILLFGVIGASGISRVVTVPLQKVAATFERISKGDLSQRAVVTTKDEIGQLAESFNLMVESLEFAVNELATFNQTLQGEIDERLKAEAELKKLTQAVVQSPVSILITNIDMIIEYVNPKYLEVTGLNEDEIVGTTSEFLKEAQQDHSKHNNLWPTITSGEVWRGEFENVRRNGEPYWEIVSIAAITDDENKITHFITLKEDITERKLLEEESKKYAFIVNSTKDYMSLVNEERRFEAVNEAFCHELSLQREDIVGEKVVHVLGEKLFEQFFDDAISRSMQGETVALQQQVSFPLEHHHEHYMDINFYPFSTAEEKITHTAVVMKDITEQKNAEMILRESEERYKGLVSNLPDVVVVHQNGIIKFINSVVEEMLGYTVEEITGQSVFNFIAEEHREIARENIQRKMNGEEIPDYEIVLVAKDGTRVYFELRGTMISYGNEPAILNVIVNITERKKYEERLKRMNEELEVRITERTSELTDAVKRLQKEIDERRLAEESLRESEEKFRALAEYSNDMIIRFDQRMHYLYVNKATEDMLGIPAREFIGKAHMEIGLSEKIAAVWSHTVREVFTTREAHRIEYEHDSGRWIDLIVSPEFRDGEVSTVLASARDITALKENERELIGAKERALEASRLKSEFLANMSHEIRTPMNAILGFTDLLNGLVTDKRQKNYLQAIRTGGKNLLTLINDILDLSKIEAGKLELVYEPVNPYSLINEIKNIFSMKIEEKNLKFILEIDENIPKYLLMDEVRLRQVLFNLIGNAVKFTDRGFIRLEVKNHFTDNDKSAVDLCFIVQDTGIGIENNSLNTIFESFKQQDGQSTKKYGGTGLGLTITKRLVEMMGGSISVESEPGKGSTFAIALPNVSAAATDNRPAADEEFDAGRVVFEPATVLIVDDVKTNRQLLTEFFVDSPVTVLEADNGSAAIEVARREKPDLICLDIRMPVMDGYEAVKRIKADERLKNIPVIAITASAMKGDKKKIIESGFDDYLLKPVHRSEMFRKLLDYLPHTLKEEAPAAIEEDEVYSGMSKEELLKITEAFDAELNELWERATKNHFVNDVVELGTKLKELAQATGCKDLAKYADDLTFYANSFDIENMGQALEQFPLLRDEALERINNM